MTQPQTLADYCRNVAAGVGYDPAAMDRWDLDLAKLKRLGSAYRAGWLNNVMSRITPLTLSSTQDYCAMADLFLCTKEDAERLLDQFDEDLELFCTMAGLEVTPHMTRETVSPELKSHIDLYEAVQEILVQKFTVIARDPVTNLAENTLIHGTPDNFVSGFVQQRFAA